MSRLTRAEKAALLFIMTRGGAGLSSNPAMRGRLVRKGMLESYRVGRAPSTHTYYKLTIAGVQAAKAFMGREEPRSYRRWFRASACPKWGKSGLRFGYDRFGYRDYGRAE